MVSWIEEGQGCHLYYEVYTQFVLWWVVVERMSIQSIEEYLWIFMSTIFEKGGWLIAVTGMMQIIAVIVNNVAIWTIIVVMYIIITIIEGAIVVDSCRMMMNKTMMISIGEWGVGQTHHGAAMYMRNFMHNGAVMTEGTHFEYTIWALIIVLIALIHSEHVLAYITEMLRAAIGWSR